MFIGWGGAAGVGGGVANLCDADRNPQPRPLCQYAAHDLGGVGAVFQFQFGGVRGLPECAAQSLGVCGAGRWRRDFVRHGHVFINSREICHNFANVLS